ncbi:low molecular weight protein-tyrosine-phosphatase [Poseidonocella sedimentorum]|uniref:protein-tyrosine-phosphatase n=1 Tax=Poseidonocella sedimentorum TaxID=871652 RepID=A0A1I6ELU1_9RHOB|nr:low molecular weight protein-tyrosine-phosphatase [Poseidonocella sedimentorum]SFR18521.1 protein-tyrosine phosphatase [Poseidonocella sedimentorum]
MRLLFVCLGNICRSPAAEAVMRAKAPELFIDSAGTGSWHIGEMPYGPMQAAASRRGYDLSPLRARQFHTDDFTRFDLILAMDRQNLDDIETLRPAGAPCDTALFTSPLQGAPSDVPDPYFTRDFDAALTLIEAGATAWIKTLQTRKLKG